MKSNRTAYEDNQVSHPSSSSWNAIDSPSPIPNRIPADVFAPTSTTSQAEWSTASNESLFSIHLGNMSFNESSLMYTPGELDSPMMSSPLFDFLVPSATPRSTEYGMKSGEEDDCGSFNAAAAETMWKVLREKESQHNNNNIVEEANLGRSMSQLSDASAKSFAFPILTEKADKNDTMKKSTNNRKQSGSQPCSNNGGTTPQQNTQPPETLKPQRSLETPKKETPKSPTLKTSQNGGHKRRFSCFSCFPSCS